MRPQEFIIWLKGFLEASGKGGLETHQVDKIRQAVDNIREPVEDTRGVVQPNPNYPGMTVTPNVYPRVSDGDMVPYHTICGCNTANGGSGLCGCVMPNKLVPKTSKTNLYTTTSDNTPFNWQYNNSKND